MAISANQRRSPLGVACLLGLAAAVAGAWPVMAQPQESVAPAPSLTLCDAIHAALEQNPELAAARQGHGVAAAGVVIARAYPFNPIWESRVRSAFPASAGVTNKVPTENTILLEMEVRGQGKHRKAAAAAALTRTDWEIAAQEMSLTIRVIRAFDTVVYRYYKNRLILDTIALNKKTADQGEDLVKAGKLRPADLIILRTEIDDARAQLGQSRTALATASSELHAAVGVPSGTFILQGDLAPPPTPTDSADVLAEAARWLRPDRMARQAAVDEADSRLRLERANRFGNPTVGPTYEYDNSRINNVGVIVTVPLPVLNIHRGDLLQREAEKTRAALELRQTDVQIEQQVEAALARMKQARAWADTYEHEVVPNLETSLKQIRDLFEHGDPSVDALRILDVQRKLLKARDGLLDAQLEVRQAVADLAAALGDPSIAAGPCAAR